jgi:hypothetical protein
MFYRLRSNAMNLTVQSQQTPLDSITAAFFRASVGKWRSDRRYYTLKNEEVQEVISFLTVRFLDQGCPELVHLAQLHGLDAETALTFGVESTWESNYEGPSQKESKGSTVFGVLGSGLYRDRGFATPKPIIAQFTMVNAKTMRLHTEYGGSAFEEELKLIGDQHRTRQTIISRSGKEIMVGQYLEKRL